MTERTDLPDLLTKAEAAAKLHVSVRTVERLIAEKTLPAVYPSKRSVRVTASALQAHLERTAAEAVRS